MVATHNCLASLVSITQRVRWWLVSDPLVVAGIAAALLISTYALAGMSVSWPVVLGVSAGSALVYRWDRTPGTAEEDAYHRPARRAWMRRHRFYLNVCTVGYVLVAGWAFLQLEAVVQGVAVGLAAISAAYVWPSWRLKRIGVLKTPLVAGAWALGVTLVPLLQGGASALVIGGFVAYRFLWLVPNILCSDWADRSADAKAGLTTWAHRLGHTGVRWVAAGCAAWATAGALAMAWSTGNSLWLGEAVGAALLAYGTAHCPAQPDERYRVALDLWMAFPGVLVLVMWG